MNGNVTLETKHQALGNSFATAGGGRLGLRKKSSFINYAIIFVSGVEMRIPNPAMELCTTRALLHQTH